jgi:hypothetical protein
VSRLLLVAILLLAAVGCQGNPTGRGASAATSTTTTTRGPMVGQPGYTGYPTKTTSPPTTRERNVRDDGHCDNLERGSNSPDCDADGGQDREVPASWVPCGQTGAYCPPDYDAPVLAYDPDPGRRWTALDEYIFEQRMRRLLRESGLHYRWSDAYTRSTWPRTRYGTYDHSWPSDPGPGSASRPIQPYPASPGDPNDADHDGVACEYGCKN